MKELLNYKNIMVFSTSNKLKGSDGLDILLWLHFQYLQHKYRPFKLNIYILTKSHLQSFIFIF